MAYTKLFTMMILAFPLGLALSRRQVHLGWEFTLLAKKTRDSKGSSAEVASQKDKKPQTEARISTPSYSKWTHCNTKESATVRATLLAKKDSTVTVQLPEELRDPSVALAACASGPKRSELDQRKVRKTQFDRELKELRQKQANSQKTVQCMPFVGMPMGQDNALQESFETPEELLAKIPNVLRLAMAFIALRKELMASRVKYETITKNYLELLDVCRGKRT